MLSAGSLYLGSLEWRAHVLFGRAYVYVAVDPLQSLKDTIEAVQTYPYDWEIRQQIYLAIVNLARVRDVVMDRETEAWAWGLSTSASPWSPLLHSVKIEVPE